MIDSFNFDLFISYSRDDNGEGQISELVGRIQKEYRDFTGGEELQVFFDQREVASIDKWRHAQAGICSSRLLLACLSPHYLESGYCSWEFSEFLKHRGAHGLINEDVVRVHFVEVLGCDEKGFEQRAAGWVTELRRRRNFDFCPFFDEGAAALKEAAVQALLSRGYAQTSDGLISGPRANGIQGNIDRNNGHFAGRFAELRRLRELVAFESPGVITAINGADGIGKTTLAIEYARAFGHEYPGGCWQVQCGGCEDLRVALQSLASIRDLAFELTEIQKRNLDLGFERVIAELKQRANSAKPSRLLLLLDNVDKQKLLHSLNFQRLPQAEWLHIIATTPILEQRLFDRQKYVSWMTLRRLPDAESLTLLERYQPGERFVGDQARRVAREIAQLLGGFPLAMERAAIFLGQFGTEVEFAAFRDRLRIEGLSEFDQVQEEREGDSDYTESCVRAALNPSLERLGEAERTALIFAALLPADQVSLPWVRTLTAQMCPELAEEKSHLDSDSWQFLVQRLFSLRLLQPGANLQEARMHRLIQKLVRLHAGANIVAMREQALLAHLKARAEFLWEGWVNQENRWELVPLLAAAWQWLRRGAGDGVYLANQAFGVLRNLGHFAETEPLMRCAVAVEEERFGSNHPNVATCLNNLGALLHETNRLKEAEPIYRRALAICEQSFGPNDPNVATCLNNLAQLLRARDREDQAEPLYRRVIAIDEQGFGPSHPKIATHLNNLAQLLQATDRPQEAEPLYRRALAIDEQRLGPNDPRVATHLSNLAQVLQATNRSQEAKSLYERALAIDERCFGPHHPRVATDLNNLAFLLRSTARFGEAEKLYRRALAIDDENFGSDHPTVGSDLNNLAALLEATNRRDDAEQLMRLMLGIFLRSTALTAHEHPFLRTGIRNYAAVLVEMGRNPAQIIAQLNDLSRPFGINFGLGTLSEIARLSHQRQMRSWQPALRRCLTRLTCLLRKAVALLGRASRGL